MLAAVPIKPFGVAKRRLEGALNAAQRSSLGRAVAAHTLAVLADCHLDVAVITADRGVAKWAIGRGARVIEEQADAGLNGAARSAIAVAGDRPWAIVHADLPLLRPADILAVTAARPVSGYALAPSSDGGTNLIAGVGHQFPFSYGAGSFARHLADVAGNDHVVVTRLGLALDLDTAADLAAIRPLAAWLA